MKYVHPQQCLLAFFFTSTRKFSLFFFFTFFGDQARGYSFSIMNGDNLDLTVECPPTDSSTRNLSKLHSNSLSKSVSICCLLGDLLYATLCLFFFNFLHCLCSPPTSELKIRKQEYTDNVLIFEENSENL